MPKIEGREIKEGITDVKFIGDAIVIRVDDFANSAFWLTLAFTPEEFGELLARYENHLIAVKNYAALRALMAGTL